MKNFSWPQVYHEESGALNRDAGNRFGVRRIVTLFYATLCYLVLSATVTYTLGFVGNILVPKSVDSGPSRPLTESVLTDISLLLGVITQHVILDRRWFTLLWKRVIPPALDRPSRILFVSLGMLFLVRQWRPISTIVWTIANSNAKVVVWILFALGLVGIALAAGLFLILLSSREAHSATTKKLRWLIGLAVMAVLLATPRMTAGHLLFALGILISIFFALRLSRSSTVCF